ncbi:MAG TPA: hypothetical protein VGK18_04025 [Propionicimonas sp.]|uniref:hypothetical protein n=1 Tax=Propionicimonas sp. TaxID=1955623 RepID=UPI002F40F0BF
MTVRLTREFTSTGIDARALQAMERQGTLIHVRRGAYSDTAQDGARAAHRQLIEGTWPLLGANTVLSHGSAATLHGLPLWGSLLERVSVTRPTGGHGVRRPYLHVWRAPLSSAEVTTRDGFRLTSLERTALDSARQLRYEQAVAVLDAALHLGADPGLLARMLLGAAGRKGVRTARAALAFADKRAESVGESISRVRMAEVGLPAPVLQFEVFSRLGVWVARTDFWWREQRVVGEFDGRVKYTGPAGDVADVVMAEKRREQAIRDAGFWFVRWGWQDLDDRDAFTRRILRAFASAPS